MHNSQKIIAFCWFYTFFDSKWFVGPRNLFFFLGKIDNKLQLHDLNIFSSDVCQHWKCKKCNQSPSFLNLSVCGPSGIFYFFIWWFILWSNIQKRKENIENGLFFKVIHFYNKIIVKKLLLKIYANLGAEARVS